MGHGTLARVVSVFGGVALAFALLSIVDLAVPRPYDGVVLEADQSRARSPCARWSSGRGPSCAGIRPATGSSASTARCCVLDHPRRPSCSARHRSASEVPYLVRRGGGGRGGPASSSAGASWAAPPTSTPACSASLFFGVDALRPARASRSSAPRRSSTSSAPSSCSSWSAACGRPRTPGSTGWCSTPAPSRCSSCPPASCTSS